VTVPTENPPEDPTVRWRLTWPTDAERPAPAPTEAPPASSFPPRPATRPDEISEQRPDLVMPPSGDAARVARFVVEPYDRLGDEMTSEIRSIQIQVDADLASVRSEMSNLRQAIGDVAERVQLRQLRQLRGTVDQLRDDITALRRVVLEWPELEQVSADITEINAALADLRTQRSPRGRGGKAGPVDADVVAVVSELRDEVASLGEQIANLNGAGGGGDARVSVAALAPLIDEIGGLREEVASLKRRISLRASGKP
jgi:hypothetical protein